MVEAEWTMGDYAMAAVALRGVDQRNPDGCAAADRWFEIALAATGAHGSRCAIDYRTMQLAHLIPRSAFLSVTAVGRLTDTGTAHKGALLPY